MYKLDLSKKADRQLKSIIAKTNRDIVLSALREIKEDLFLHKPLINELSGRFTYKLGVYRIIYIVNEKDKVITVLTADHRSLVYQN